jgi:hypothetical protein
VGYLESGNSGRVMEQNPFVQLGVSLMLGLLVGLQRERTNQPWRASGPSR